MQPLWDGLAIACINYTILVDRFVMIVPLKPYRFRLPAGFSHLHPNFGAIVRERRVADGHKQEMFAIDIGVTRAALSNIERGRALPRPETLDRILAVLEIDFDVVAVKGAADRTSRPYADGAHALQQFQLGQWLRDSRKRQGFTLRQVALWSGVSAAQLSRIERGEGLRSALFAVAAGDEGLHEDDRRVVFANPVIEAICVGTFVALESSN